MIYGLWDLCFRQSVELVDAACQVDIFQPGEQAIIKFDKKGTAFKQLLKPLSYPPQSFFVQKSWWKKAKRHENLKKLAVFSSFPDLSTSFEYESKAENSPSNTCHTDSCPSVKKQLKKRFSLSKNKSLPTDAHS